MGKLWRLVGETVPEETEVGDAAALAAVYAEARRVGLPILRKDFEAARSPPSVVISLPIECCGIADWMLGGAKREFTDQLAAFAFPGPRFEVPEGYFTRTLEPLGDGPFFYRFLAREGVVTAESMRCFHTTSNSRFSVNHS